MGLPSLRGMLATSEQRDRRFLIAGILFFLAALAQLATAWLQYQTQTLSRSVGNRARNADQRTYSWIGDDFPNSLYDVPFQDLNVPSALSAIDGDDDPVAMIIENSRHYGLTSPSGDDDVEYWSMFPGRRGFIRLGPERRFFGMSLYHQVHCLESLRSAIKYGLDHKHHRSEHGQERKHERAMEEHTMYGKPAPIAHADHCLNYLRQTILCAADTTLEPEIVLGSRDVGEGLGVTHVCRDWTKVYEFAAENAREYTKYLATNGSHSWMM